MTVRALGLKAEEEGGLDFADLGAIPDWARPYLSKAVAAGLLKGYGDGTLRPNAEVTRGEIAVIAARAAGLDVDPSAVPSFKDAAQIPAWALPSVAAAAQAELVRGRGGGVFAPQAHATRAETVTLIMALLDRS